MCSQLKKSPADASLLNALQKRKEQNAFRSLLVNTHLVDFCSNDYLGFARSSELQDKIRTYTTSENQHFIGSTGSRLLSGNSTFAEDLEKHIAHYHNAPAGLLFNSGYDANIGLFSSVARKEDTVIYDELVHASIHDGIRLSRSSSHLFRHNDLNHLEERLKTAKGNVFVVVESVYSMDGDFAPLKEISLLCSLYNANLIVDEAHATGLFGEGGKGRVTELGLEQDVFARVHTFGKALGCHGAIVLGSTILRDFLINFSRSFIYTTAMPFHSLQAIKSAYDILSKQDNKSIKLSTLTDLFKSKIKVLTTLEIIDSSSPIQCIIFSGNDRVKKLANEIQDAGFDVRAILSPTVPKGKERLRICIHIFNTEQEIEGLVDTIARTINKLKAE